MQVELVLWRICWNGWFDWWQQQWWQLWHHSHLETPLCWVNLVGGEVGGVMTDDSTGAISTFIGVLCCLMLCSWAVHWYFVSQSFFLSDLPWFFMFERVLLQPLWYLILFWESVPFFEIWAKKDQILVQDQILTKNEMGKNHLFWNSHSFHERTSIFSMCWWECHSFWECDPFGCYIWKRSEFWKGYKVLN